MSPKSKMGRPSIFRDKKGGRYVQGIITKAGGRLFSAHRKRLAEIANRAPAKVSDADVIEYLARGESNSVAYIVGVEAAERALPK